MTRTAAIERDLATLAAKLSYDEYEDPVRDCDTAKVADAYQLWVAAGSTPEDAVATVAALFEAYAVCDWCQTGPQPIAIDSTAGRRCRDCHDTVGLCTWCGEAPVDDVEHCTVCALAHPDRV